MTAVTTAVIAAVIAAVTTAVIVAVIAAVTTAVIVAIIAPATHQQQQNKSKYTATELTIESWRDCQRVKREATGPKRKEYSV